MGSSTNGSWAMAALAGAMSKSRILFPSGLPPELGIRQARGIYVKRLAFLGLVLLGNLVVGTIIVGLASVSYTWAIPIALLIAIMVSVLGVLRRHRTHASQGRRDRPKRLVVAAGGRQPPSAIEQASSSPEHGADRTVLPPKRYGVPFGQPLYWTAFSVLSGIASIFTGLVQGWLQAGLVLILTLSAAVIVHQVLDVRQRAYDRGRGYLKDHWLLASVVLFMIAGSLLVASTTGEDGVTAQQPKPNIQKYPYSLNTAGLDREPVPIYEGGYVNQPFKAVTKRLDYLRVIIGRDDSEQGYADGAPIGRVEFRILEGQRSIFAKEVEAVNNTATWTYIDVAVQPGKTYIFRVTNTEPGARLGVYFTKEERAPGTIVQEKPTVAPQPYPHQLAASIRGRD